MGNIVLIGAVQGIRYQEVFIKTVFAEQVHSLYSDYRFILGQTVLLFVAFHAANMYEGLRLQLCVVLL